MHPQVRDKLYELLRVQEGEIPFMYLDLSVNPRRGRRLVTVGIGCMIDPMPDYVPPLEWTHKVGGRRATPEEVRAEWRHVSGMQDHAPGQNGWAFQGVTNWRLHQQGILAIFRRKFDDLARDVPGSCSELRDINNFPPDAQLAIMTHAWGFGPAPLAEHPNVRRACGARDWFAAARAVGWQRAARTRIKELRVMFNNAAAVEDPRYQRVYSRNMVHWPQELHIMARTS